MESALSEQGKPKLEKLEFECEVDMEKKSELVYSDENETILPDQNYSELEQDRIDLLESGMKTCRDRLDGFGQELKLLFVEINIISEFIREQFGFELINRVSQLRKHIHDFDEIEELTKSLSAKSGRVRRSNRQATATWNKEQERRERLRERKRRFYNEERDECSDDENIDLRKQRHDFACKSEGNEQDFTFDTQDVEADVDQDQRNEGVVKLEKTDGQRVERPPEGPEGRGRRLKPSILRHRKHHLQSQSSSLEPDLTSPLSASPPRRNGRQRNKNRLENPRARGRPKKTMEEKLISIPGKPPRQCDECGKILKGPGSLKSHMNMHADLRPYPCLEEGCGKRFRVKNKLNLHMMIHKGDKKEQCRFCGKLFYFAKDLARHERTHTGEKPNVCPVCSKSFNVKQHLTLHLRTHTGERPYQCSICEKWFSQANSLRIHKKIHVKAAEDAAAGVPPKKPRATTRPKRRATPATESKTVATESDNHEVDLRNGDDKIFDNIVTVVLPISPGTRLDPAEIIEIHQAESPSHSSKLTYRNASIGEKEASPGQGNQVQVITLNSQETQILDHVPEGWKLMTTSHGGMGSSLTTVQFPLYGFEFQQNRLPVIASTSAVSLELQQAAHSQLQANAETTTRYFQEHSKE